MKLPNVVLQRQASNVDEFSAEKSPASQAVPSPSPTRQAPPAVLDQSEQKARSPKHAISPKLQELDTLPRALSDLSELSPRSSMSGGSHYSLAASSLRSPRSNCASPRGKKHPLVLPRLEKQAESFLPMQFSMPSLPLHPTSVLQATTDLGRLPLPLLTQLLQGQVGCL